MWFVALTFVSFIISCVQSAVVVHFDRFTDCPNSKTLAIITDHFSSKQINNKVYVNVTMKVKEDLPTNILGQITLKRCESKESPDTCSTFPKVKGLKYCERMYGKDFGPNSVFPCMKPKYECPLKKNVYTAINCPMDFSALEAFGQLRYYWKIKSQLFVGKREVLCQLIYTTAIQN